MTRGKSVATRMLAAFQCFRICYVYICIIYIYYICNAFTQHRVLPVVFLLCDMSIYFCCLCTLGRSSQSERSLCCYRLNTWISVDDKAVGNFFQITFPLLACQLDALLQSGTIEILPSVPWYKLFTTPSLVLNWCASKDYQVAYKAHALKFGYFMSSHMAWDFMGNLSWLV